VLADSREDEEDEEDERMRRMLFCIQQEGRMRDRHDLQEAIELSP
jgi:hypothetical protein